MAQTYIGPLSRLIFKFLQAAFSIELMIRKGHRYAALQKWPRPWIDWLVDNTLRTVDQMSKQTWFRVCLKKLVWFFSYQTLNDKEFDLDQKKSTHN